MGAVHLVMVGVVVRVGEHHPEQQVAMVVLEAVRRAVTVIQLDVEGDGEPCHAGGQPKQPYQNRPKASLREDHRLIVAGGAGSVKPGPGFPIVFTRVTIRECRDGNPPRKPSSRISL